MTSTSYNIGLSTDKSSSRVLKPPGGGHTNIFGESEVKVNNPRPKYDQQNSTNLNFCMNTTDPNILVEQKKQEVAAQQAPPTNGNESAPPTAQNQQQQSQPDQKGAAGPRGRVPPGGFSSGLW